MLVNFFRNAVLFISLFSTLSLFSGVDYKVEDQPEALRAAMKLVSHGTLMQKENGYLYLQVPREYIADIIPLIKTAHKIVPPGHFKSKKGIGAHISVIYEQEPIVGGIWSIQEVGRQFSFSVKEIRTVILRKENSTRKLWLIAVEAGDLEKLRVKYGLFPKLKGHDYHITLGSEAVLNTK